MQTNKALPLGIRAQLFQQLAQMEEAGLPFDRAFAALALPPIAKQRLATMRSLMQRIEFASAGERSGLFTRLEARLILAAMSAGSPARVYRRLADFYTARAMQAAKVKSRMVLPVVIFLLAACLDPLPGLVTGTTGVLTYIDQVLRPVIAAGIVGLGLRWWLTGASSNSRLRMTPILGELVLRQNIRDFFQSLGLMLDAGISMLDALPGALDTVSDSSIRKQLAEIAPLVIAGSTLSQAARAVDDLGNPTSRHRLLEFIATGEASGTLPDMLLRHTELETATINEWYEQIATWTPRLIYGAIMLWMIVSLLGGAPSSPPVM